MSCSPWLLQLGQSIILLKVSILYVILADTHILIHIQSSGLGVFVGEIVIPFAAVQISSSSAILAPEPTLKVTPDEGKPAVLTPSYPLVVSFPSWSKADRRKAWFPSILHDNLHDNCDPAIGFGRNRPLIVSRQVHSLEPPFKEQDIRVRTITICLGGLTYFRFQYEVGFKDEWGKIWQNIYYGEFSSAF